MCSFNQGRGRTSRPSSSRASQTSTGLPAGRGAAVCRARAGILRKANAGDILLWIVSEGSVAVAVVVINDSRFECWCCCACVCARGRILNMRMRYPSVRMGFGNRVLDWKSTNSQAAASESCTVSLKVCLQIRIHEDIGTQLCTRVRCTFL